MENKIKIPIKINSDKDIEIFIYSENDKETIKVISEQEAIEFNESKYQLLEGCSYEYKCPDRYSLKQIKGIVKKSKIHSNTGRITTRVYTGKLVIEILDLEEDKIVGEFKLEIRSVKTNYRDDYRIMLEDITEESVAIIMDENSVVTQDFSMDYKADSETLYQQFSFVKSMVLSESFDQSIFQIIKYPVSKWKNQEKNIRSSKIKKVNNKIIKQIGRSKNRTKLNKNSSLYKKIDSFPNKLNYYEKIDSLDTPENQFIKFVINVLKDFIYEIKQLLDNKHEKEDANYIYEKLNNILHRDFFREISNLSILNLNSPILQRKEGYREIYKIWINFDVASKLFWEGSDEIFSAGQKNIALLYEYWVFFKLLNIFEEKFSIKGKKFSEIIEKTKTGLGLKLKAGRHILLKGIYKSDNREFNVEYSYNKVFKGSESYPKNGSWTRQMRPDYSLCFWPKGFSKTQASNQEIITFIHFDAKYKIQNYIDNLMKNKNSSKDDNSQEYKRDDLIKMHAYKDAIRRTAGAYIIYPGNRSYIKRGYHELLPGLGAFPLNPSDKLKDTSEISEFIDNVIKHLHNRASQREKLSYYKFDIFKEKELKNINFNLPEKYIDERIMPIDQIYVIVGYVKDKRHFNWIKDNKLYNLRINDYDGSINLDFKKSAAKYILLYNDNEKFIENGEIKLIKEEGPKIFSKNKMIKLNYKNPRDFYLVYKISEKISKELNNLKWNIKRILKEEGTNIYGEPICLSLKELLKYKI